MLPLLTPPAHSEGLWTISPSYIDLELDEYRTPKADDDDEP